MFSDAHEEIKAGIARVRDPAALPRPPSAQCAHPAGKNSDRVVGSFIATTFAQPDHAAAKAQWRRVATRGGADARQTPKLSMLGEPSWRHRFKPDGECREGRASLHDIPGRHRTKLYGTQAVQLKGGNHAAHRRGKLSQRRLLRERFTLGVNAHADQLCFFGGAWPMFFPSAR